MKSQQELIAFARECLDIRQDAPATLFCFEGRGSDRSYYRFSWGGDQSVILVNYQSNRVENTRYADIACFLQENRIPAPAILHHDTAGCVILMEDLGDIDLWTLRSQSWNVRGELYRRTLEIVHRLHSFATESFPSDRISLMAPFGPDLYRWEREYFKENFVSRLCGVELPSDLSAQLERELAGLAEKLSSGRTSLVHRDLQSQNVMVFEDEPYLIDFQGMRFGTRFYDLGSLLGDPYVEFSDGQRLDLLSFYYRLAPDELEWKDFQQAFWEATAQRLMQALGAYGFLGIVRGLKNYLAHVPAAIRNLHAAARNADSLPTLQDVCTRCESALASQETGERPIL